MFREWIDWMEAASGGHEWTVGLLHGYLDGSGQQDRDRIVCCVCVAAFGNQVAEFTQAWRVLLLRNGLRDTGLTMKRALLAHEPLSEKIPAQSVAERIEALRPFALAIRKHLPLSVAVSVDSAAYKALPAITKTALGSKADFLAFGSAMLIVSHYADPEKDRLNIVSDDDDKMAWQCYRFYRRVKATSEDFRKKVTAITFANDKDHPQIQAADVLASLWRLEAQKISYGVPYDYAPLLRAIVSPEDEADEIIASHTHHWGKEDLEGIAKKYQALATRFPLATLPDFWA